MLLKRILPTTSALAALGILLGSACHNPVWAMDDQESLPTETVSHIVRYRAEIEKDFGDLGKYIVTDWENLRNYRLVSGDWRAGTDQVIREDKLFTLRLSPANYTLKGLKHMASLTTTIYLVQWSKENSRFIDNALSQENASHKKFLAHASKIYCCQPGDPVRLTSQDIGDEGVISLGSALKNFTQLKSLVLHSSMDEKGRKSLFNALPHLTQLSRLDINTVLGEEGGKALGKILPSLKTLEYLKICGSMGPLGTKKFAKGLSSLQKLETLLLPNNGIGDIGVVALADQLKHLKNLKELHIDGDSARTAPGKESRFIREAGEKYFHQKIQKQKQKHNPTLRATLG